MSELPASDYKSLCIRWNQLAGSYQDHLMTSTVFQREIVGCKQLSTIGMQCDVLLSLTAFMSGTRSYKQPLDILVWWHCYLEYAYKAPPFYPKFDAVAQAILEELNMNHEDITISNARAIYWHLWYIMSSQITIIIHYAMIIANAQRSKWS